MIFQAALRPNLRPNRPSNHSQPTKTLVFLPTTAPIQGVDQEIWKTMIRRTFDVDTESIELAKATQIVAMVTSRMQQDAFLATVKVSRHPEVTI